MDTTLLAIVLVVAVVALVLVVLLRRRRDSVGTTARPEVAGDRRGLAKAARSLGSALRNSWGSGISEQTWEGIEEALIASDLGATSATKIVRRIKDAQPSTTDEARSLLANELRSAFSGRDRRLHLEGQPAVVLIVGVNGSGKTTTIGKLGAMLETQGKSVLFAGADTFRAAAGEQLAEWGRRSGIQVVSGQVGGDPAAVVYDALESGRARSADVLIVDTAGRLHAKRNLMAELEKIHRVAGGDRVDEVLLVLDATTGQNGLAQVSQFSEAVPLTGVVLTKLDGTARGGIVVAVETELGVPVKLVGVGEALDDLVPFEPDSFVDDLLEMS